MKIRNFSQHDPCNGLVIVEVQHVYAQEKRVGDKIIHLSAALSTDTKNHLATRRGTVVKVPENLDCPLLNYCWTSRVPAIQPGDTVWWTAQAIQQVIMLNPFALVIDAGQDRKLITVPYNELVARLRDGELRGMNDYALCKSVPKPNLLKTEVLDDYLWYKDRFEVVHTPCDTVEYDWRPGIGSGWSAIPVEPGMTVKTSLRPFPTLEREGFETVDPFFVIQTHNIHGFYELEDTGSPVSQGQELVG